ncbi:MAG: hypothetical protein OXC83_00930 [Chloroflexi bacterium]|nr:hypothetical protein [Chloroflexota bacterium]
MVGRPRPWPDDSVLARHKFINAYRACYRASPVSHPRRHLRRTAIQ